MFIQIVKPKGFGGAATPFQLTLRRRTKGKTWHHHWELHDSQKLVFFSTRVLRSLKLKLMSCIRPRPAHYTILHIKVSLLIITSTFQFNSCEDYIH